MATNPSVKVYGFVSDTAFYNRDFTNPGTTSTVDQGACCLTDKVASMFGRVGIIKDLRDARAPMTQLNDVSVWADAPDALKESDGVLDGTMSIVFDVTKHNEDVKNLFSSEINKSVIQGLFNLIEYIAYYQKMINAQERVGVAVSTLADSTAYAEIAASAGNAVVDAQETEIDCFTTVQTAYAKGREGIVPHLRFVRDKFTVTFVVKDSGNNPVTIELHLWLGRDMFLGSKSINEGGYPLSTITDVVLPCPADKLYTLLDTYGSVSAFASASSEGKNSVYHITDYEYQDGVLIGVTGEYNTNDATLNAVVRSDDHTGVYTFSTNYFGYPDTQPNNSFTLSFKVVYKGARPPMDDVKTALRRAVLDITPAHTEDEWRKKLPGIISERWFFMIPLYDNVWTKDEVTHRYGIVDTSVSRITALISRVLGASYASGAQSVVPFAQLIIPKYSKFPVVVVPKMDNPTNSKLLTSIYKDYIGINAASADPSDDHSGDHLQDESDLTQSFTELFNAALAKAYNKNLPHGSITGFGGLFEMFTSADGVTHCVLSRNSYDEYFG